MVQLTSRMSGCRVLLQMYALLLNRSKDYRYSTIRMELMSEFWCFEFSTWNNFLNHNQFFSTFVPLSVFILSLSSVLWKWFFVLEFSWLSVYFCVHLVSKFMCLKKSWKCWPLSELINYFPTKCFRSIGNKNEFIIIVIKINDASRLN